MYRHWTTYPLSFVNNIKQQENYLCRHVKSRLCVEWLHLFLFLFKFSSTRSNSDSSSTTIIKKLFTLATNGASACTWGGCILTGDLDCVEIHAMSCCFKSWMRQPRRWSVSHDPGQSSFLWSNKQLTTKLNDVCFRLITKCHTHPPYWRLSLYN